MSALPRRDSAMAGDTNNPFYFNTSHWRAVDGILEGVEDRAGVMVLTGPPGSGKTMLMRAISEGLKESTPPLFLKFASLNFREFVNFLHTQLKVEDEITEAPNKAVALREFLYVQANRNETAVVFIDEAHNLEPDVLKMLPKLARFDTLENGRTVGLQFVLIGSADLRELLDDPDFDQVRAKIGRNYELRFFTRAELAEFLKKRLAPIARTTDEPITQDAIEAIGKYTGGSPRLIGMICSHAMLFAAENPGKSIDAKMVREAADALMMEPAENPFAHEAEMPEQAAGPYSESDLNEDEKTAKAKAKAKAKPAVFGDTETIYSDESGADSAEDEAAPKSAMSSLFERAPLSGDDAEVPGFSAPRRVAEDRVPEPQGDAEPTDTAVTEAGGKVEAGEAPASTAGKPSQAKKKAAGADAGDEYMLDDDEDDLYGEYDSFDDNFDLDDDDDDLDMEEGEGAQAAAGKKTGSRKGQSFLQRLGIGRGKSGAKSQERIVGANRKREKAKSDTAPATAASRPRKPRTRVAGERERNLRYAGAGVGLILLAVGGWVGYKLFLPKLSGLQSQIAGVFSSDPAPAPVPSLTQTPQLAEAPSLAAPSLPVTSGGAPAVPTLGEAPQAAPSPPAPVLQAGSAADAPKAEEVVTTTSRSGGWGAKVSVEREESPLAGVTQAIAEPVGNIAGGVLDGVERVLNAGGDNASDGLRGVFKAASEQVRELRRGLITSDLSPEEARAKAVTMAAEGDTHFAAKRMIAPKGGNAYDAYRNALTHDPDNARAQAGINKLREFYATKAEKAREARSWDEANTFFETAIAISTLRPIAR